MDCALRLRGVVSVDASYHSGFAPGLARGGSDADAEPAWAAFLSKHSGLLLHVARSLGGDDDAAMDRYAFMLDALRRDGCLRLRGYVADGRSQFSTWLIVVARRLCLDEYRHRYGRPQGRDVLPSNAIGVADRLLT